MPQDNITIAQGPLPSYRTAVNLTATTDPTVTADASNGYGVNSTWLNTTTQVLWRCVSATAGAAVWVPMLGHPGYATGRYYSTIRGAASSLQIPATNTIYFHPFILPAKAVVTALVLKTVSGGAGSAVKAAVWANSSNGPVGAPLMADNSGAATTGSNASINLTGATGTLYPGVTYWFGSKYTGTTPTMQTLSSVNLELGWLWGMVANSLAQNNGLSMSDTYSNDMPTIASNQSFTVVNSTGVALGGFAT